MNRTEGRRTLVVFDEIHHAGDAKSWGEATREAFAGATRRLALTGTPFRSDDSPIPFITYEPDAAGVGGGVAGQEFVELSDSGGSTGGGAWVYTVAPDKVIVFGEEHGQTTYRF